MRFGVATTYSDASLQFDKFVEEMILHHLDLIVLLAILRCRVHRRCLPPRAYDMESILVARVDVELDPLWRVAEQRLR
jgi:hypothetical protein